MTGPGPARFVAAKVQPEDLVLFSPRWVDPIGRLRFGDEIMTLAREARPDETRFPRALEVSIRGAHAPELDGWKLVGEETAGAVTIRTLENPHPATVIDDLLLHYPAAMKVFNVDAGGRAQECGFTRAGTRTGGIGFGPAIPSERFVCGGGGQASLTVIAPLDYRPRRCILAPPLGGAATLRVRFTGVNFGSVLHGHHTIYVEAERKRRGPPVTATFHDGSHVIGTVTHNDGDGWAGFDMNTSDLAGQKADLVVDITAPSAPGDRESQRVYCFEADTR